MSEFPKGREFTQPTWPAPWAFGPALPKEVYPPLPSQQQLDQTHAVNVAAYDAAKNIILNTVEVPWHAAPYRSQPVLMEARWIVGPAGTPVNAAAQAAAVALGVAAAPFSGPLVPTTQPTTAAFVVGLTLTVPQGWRAVIQGVGLGSPSAGKDALRWRVVNGGIPLGIGAQGGGLWPRGSADDLMVVNMVSGLANNLFTIEVRNLDTLSGYLVEARVTGYMFPVAQNDDSPRSLVNDGGPDTNGRWFGPNGPR